MRAKIAQRRRLAPSAQAPVTEQETPAAATPTPTNGQGAPDTINPVNPPPEIVYAVVSLGHRIDELDGVAVKLGQRLGQLEEAMQGISLRQNLNVRALLLKARSEALKRAIEVIPPGGPDAAADIEDVAGKFLEWLCLGAPGAEPDK
jgi:hypothetical protein